MKFITKVSLKITFFMIRRIIKNHYTTELIPKRHEYLKCFLDIVFEQQGQMGFNGQFLSNPFKIGRNKYIFTLIS